MFIEPKENNNSKLRRSGMSSRVPNTSLLRSSRIDSDSRSYKYFAPTALLLLSLLGFGVFRASNSHASTSFEGQSPQQQMQFPEGLDYSKFQHNSRNHSRLPCLLCHRRDSNAAVPKRPGSSQHLPCAGCHAQQFSSSDSPICTICHTDTKSGAVARKPVNSDEPPSLILLRVKKILGNGSFLITM